MSKIIGVTVGTTLSPSSIKEKLKPVTSVNGVTPDENGNVKVHGSFSEADKKEIVDAVIDALPVYDGDYAVTPTATGQTLNTKKKIMSDDVHIQPIPFFEVSNTSGGNTVYIGTLDDIYPSKKAVLGKAKLGTMKL